MPEVEFRHSCVLDKVEVNPDFIFKENNRLLLAVEVETKWALSADDIVGIYQENLKELAEHLTSPLSVIDPIKQIYGYMGHTELQYGILST
jgi:hypothetical protein